MLYSLLYLVNSVISAGLSASKKEAQVFAVVVGFLFVSPPGLSVIMILNLA